MALESRVTYIALDGGLACGYIFAEKDGFGVYIYDRLQSPIGESKSVNTL